MGLWFETGFHSEQADLKLTHCTISEFSGAGLPSLVPQLLEYGSGSCLCLGICQAPQVGLLRKPEMASSLKLDYSLKKTKALGKQSLEDILWQESRSRLTSTTSKADEAGLITVIGFGIWCHLMKQNSVSGWKEVGALFFLLLCSFGSETQDYINQKIMSPPVIRSSFVSHSPPPNSYARKTRM